jgi:integrase/recombinase XerC
MLKEITKLGAQFPRDTHQKQKKNLLLDKFIRFEKRRGKRDQWITALPSRTNKLFVFLDETGIDFKTLKPKDALSYQGWLLNTKPDYAKTTVLSYMTAASAFYEFLKTESIVYANPFKEIRKVRAEKKLPRNLPKENELFVFLSTLSCFDEAKSLKDKLMAYRTHVIAELMYATGLRISEVAHLKTTDIDLDRSVVQVEDGKCRQSRICFLNEYAREVLRLYITRMRPLVFSRWNEKNDKLLFGTSRGVLEHVTNRILNQTSQTLQMPVMTSHGFRHCLGFHLLRAGCNIRYIQQILGHKNIKNTEIYTKVDQDDLKEVLDTCHPRAFGNTNP